MYGMNSRGVSELTDLEQNEFRSSRVGDFTAKMHELHN
jgi:hypothetical protein